MTDDLDAALAEHLASFDRGGSYHVDRVLKASDVETTELVYFEGAGGGSLGPFVRKRIDAAARIGGAYERLFAAQRAGRRFEHLPRLLDCWRSGDALEVVMEYIEGETLESLVGRLGATPDYARVLFPAICEAVAELHGGFGMSGEPVAPVIHRDLKPSNIMVSGAAWTPERGMAFSSLVIIDLGIARVWREGADADTVKFGTRPYAPPEQYGFGQTSVRSDIYALGALLFFCLTGHDPQPGKSMREQCTGEGVPEPLADAVCMAMALDPAQRFANVEALGSAARAAYERSIPRRARAETSSVKSVSVLQPPAVDPVPISRSLEAESVVLPQPPMGASAPVPMPVPETAPVSTAATVSSDLPALLDRPVSSRASRRGLLSRIPEPLGRIWNAMVYLSLLTFLAGSHFAVFQPTGANRAYPIWFLMIEYFLFVDGVAVLIHYAMLDKRRLRRRFEPLDRYRGTAFAKLWFKALGVLFLVMVAIIILVNATGIVNTSAA